MSGCLFVSDLHGRVDRYEKLFRAIEVERPMAVLLGGDLLPSGLMALHAPGADEADFVHAFLAPGFARLRETLGGGYPRVFLILGNDDGRA